MFLYSGTSSNIDPFSADTNVPIDPASKESVSNVVNSGTKVTDRVDLSKVNRKNKK